MQHKPPEPRPVPIKPPPKPDDIGRYTPINAEKYGHITMSNDDLEERIAADLYELSERINETESKIIGALLWKLMRQIREAYRTVKIISASNKDEGD